MRTLIEVEFDTATANQLINDGTMGKVLENVTNTLKPEVAYFLPRDGRRCALFVADLPDESTIVPFLEPFWLEGGAHVTMTPCMSAQDVIAGLGKLGKS